MPNYFRAMSPRTHRDVARQRRQLHSGDSVLGLTGMRRGTSRNGDLDVHWYDCGPRDAPTVLYAHGFNISSQSFYMQVRELQHLPLRQLLIDVRGHGLTAHQPAELSIDAAADDLITVLRDLDVTGPLIVVGHSLGGPVTLSMIRRYADELDIAGSVQIASAVKPFTDHGMTQLLGGAAGSALYRMIETLPGMAEALRKGVTDSLAPVLAVGFYAPGMPWDVIKFHAAMIQETPLETYSGFFADLRSHDEYAAAGALQDIPGYILVGELDAVAPLSQSEALHAIWPQAKLQVLPRSGHMPPLDAPGAVTTAIRRLTQPLLRQGGHQD